MSNGERIVAAAHAALDPGPMGSTLRGDFYKKFVSCGYTQDLSHVKTSCAVFVRAVLHSAGRRVTRPGKIGQGILGGWLEGLTFSHPAWEDAVGKDGVKRQPPPGAVFYRAYSKRSSGTESHVGILLNEPEPGLWVTAEGGGSGTSEDAKLLTTQQIIALNGTRCSISKLPKNVWKLDSLSRALVGWWRPELLDKFSDGPAEVITMPPTSDDLITYTGKYVKEWQTLLGLNPDGKFGKDTLAASKKKL
jgi:hypothetical protein